MVGMRQRGAGFDGWLICPVCGEPLLIAGEGAADNGAGGAAHGVGMDSSGSPQGAVRSARGAESVRCARGHSFDLAREGYLNLLRSRRTGDSKEMLLARRAFLDRGHYQPLAGALADTVGAFLGEQAGAGGCPLRVLDAGCGEGYYLDRLGQRLSEAPGLVGMLLIGLDSAKEAIRMAAKRCPDAALLVADLKERLPIADASLDAILNVFAPRDLAEFARVLMPGGLLLIAIPSPDHLIELRLTHGLLGIEEQKLERLLEALAPHFVSVGTRDLRYTLHLESDAVQTLIAMTPSQRHPQRRLVPEPEGDVSEPTAAFTLVACRKG